LPPYSHHGSRGVSSSNYRRRTSSSVITDTVITEVVIADLTVTDAVITAVTDMVVTDAVITAVTDMGVASATGGGWAGRRGVRAVPAVGERAAPISVMTVLVVTVSVMTEW
jgi:hypothetical protein